MLAAAKRLPLAGEESGGGGGGRSEQEAAKNVVKANRRRQRVAAKGRGDRDQVAAKGGARPENELAPRPTLAPEDISIESEDLVQRQSVAPADFGLQVLKIAQLLGELEKNDTSVWNTLIQPTLDLEDLPVLARQLEAEGTGARIAFDALKEAAQYIELKGQLQTLPPRGKRRSFNIELTYFINAFKGSNTPIKPNDPKLGAFKTILDYAVAAVLRLQNLKINRHFAKNSPENYTKEAVIGYCEQGLQPLLEVGNGALLTLVRAKADADTLALLAVFAAQRYVEALLTECSAYVSGLDWQEGAVAVEDLEEALTLNPFSPEPPEHPGKPLEPLSEEKLPLGKWGEPFDRIAAHVCTQAWAVLQPIHQPDEVLSALIKLLRQLLLRGMVFTAEKRRPQERPQIALEVANLEKVCGNANLQNFYIRLRDDGRPLFVDGYEDNSFIDVYELREYKPVRMKLNAAKKAAEQLQTGRKYLFGVGRTQNLWGQTPGQLSDSCKKRDDGSIEVFPA